MFCFALKHRLWVLEAVLTCTHMFSVLSKIKQNIIFLGKIYHFTAFKNRCILQKHVCFMLSQKSVHYANMPMHYAEILNGYKNDIFFNEKFEFFLIFAQNIDCGYTLEPLH